MPVYAIFMVKSYDSLGKSFIKLKYFFIRLFKRSLYQEYNKSKKDLSKQITKIVE